MVQLASAVLRPASLFPQRASSLAAWYVLYGGRAADKVAPNDSVARTIAAAKPSLARHIFSEHLDVVCDQQRPRLRGSHEYSQRHFQYRYSLPDCKVQNHLLRPCKQTQPQAQTARTQRGPHRPRRPEQRNQNNYPEGREVVQAFNPRLITCD